VSERAQGNPFYAEELIRTFRDRGDLVLEAGSHEPSEAAATVVPPSLHALIAPRVDRLPPSARELLADAAVLGKRFPLAHLRTLAPGEHFDEDLALLERRGLLDGPSSGIATLSFHHVLTQEVVYGALLQSDRKGRHRRAAETVESLYRETDRGGLRSACPSLGSERQVGDGAAVPPHRHRGRGGDGRERGGDRSPADHSAADERPPPTRSAHSSGTAFASSWPVYTSSSASGDRAPRRAARASATRCRASQASCFLKNPIVRSQASFADGSW
jgi:hypothetical protein